MLVGVADPLAQAGGGAVTRAAASLTAQGIAPAPKPGFSGAAALDARGRFAGMVNLNPSIVAGSGGAGPAATWCRPTPSALFCRSITFRPRPLRPALASRSNRWCG